MINIFFSNYALLITEKGLINNTSLTNAGLIHWRDATLILNKDGKVITTYGKARN